MKNRALFTLGIGLVLAIAFASFVNAQMEIRTEIEGGRTILVSDGRVYRMNVYADSTEHPTDIIQGVEWDVVLAGGQSWANFNIVTAYIPAPTDTEDYFYGYDMLSGWNRVDSTPDGSGELTDNVRGVDTILHGNQYGVVNGDGFLGYYEFTITPGFSGWTNFDLNEVRFTRNDYYIYNSDNGDVRIDNQRFRVVPAFPRLSFRI